MCYIPHEKLSITWESQEEHFILSLPWISMEVEVMKQERSWAKEAAVHLHSSPANENVQRLLTTFRGYPIFYTQPRPLKDFTDSSFHQDLFLPIDFSTPSSFIETFNCPLDSALKQKLSSTWVWDWDKIISKAQVPNSNLYDPLSFISYLLCYRLEWEATRWSGRGRFHQFLEALLRSNEDMFFWTTGWIAKQSWYIAKKFPICALPALTHFPSASSVIHDFIQDEKGHHKFMEIVFKDIGYTLKDFEIGYATYWLLSAFKKTARFSALAFTAMINLFEATYYEEEDPISKIIKLSSKPQAAEGFTRHHKINQDHRHCNLPLVLAQHLGPQSLDHLKLTLALFELTLNFLDDMEKMLVCTVNKNKYVPKRLLTKLK